MILWMLSSLGIGAIQSLTTSCMRTARRSLSGNSFWRRRNASNCSRLDKHRPTSLANGRPPDFNEPPQLALFSLSRKSEIIELVCFHCCHAFMPLVCSKNRIDVDHILTASAGLRQFPIQTSRIVCESNHEQFANE